MTHDEMLEVIAAHKAGGIEIEARDITKFRPGPWVDCRHPDWDFYRAEFRIKPREPREFWIVNYLPNIAYDVHILGTFTREIDARMYAASRRDPQIMHVREVL